MSLSAPAPPQAADPSQVANTQAQYNTAAGVESQAGSAVNQQNPYGSLTYSQSGTGPGGVPIYTATTQLSPAQQKLLDTLQSTQTTAEQQAGNLIGGANYGAGNPAATIGGATSGTTQALLGQETSYLNPFFTQQTTQLDTQLRNQGFDPSSPAYQQAMNNLQQSQNQSVTGFLASAEPAAYQQAVQSYELPLQTATSELGISQPGSVGANLVQTPQLSIGAPNYAGAVAQQESVQEQTYQNQLAQQNAMMSGLFGLGGKLGSAAILA
jgi:hypothetical protein